MKQVLFVMVIFLIGCNRWHTHDRDTITFRMPVEQVEENIDKVISYFESGAIGSYGIVTFRKERRLYLDGQLTIGNLDLYLADPKNKSKNSNEFNEFLENINILSKNGIASGSNVRTKVPFFLYKPLKDQRVSNLRMIIAAENDEKIALFDFLNKSEVLDRKGKLVLLKYRE